MRINLQTLCICVTLAVGCGPLVTMPDKKPNVVEPSKKFDAAEASATLARIAERCGKNNSRFATVEIAGTLSEMIVDGLPEDYAERVRKAVPSIGGKPARDLDASEIETLRGVR